MFLFKSVLLRWEHTPLSVALLNCEECREQVKLSHSQALVNSRASDMALENDCPDLATGHKTHSNLTPQNFIFISVDHKRMLQGICQF